jgi:hypothetical protein
MVSARFLSAAALSMALLVCGCSKPAPVKAQEHGSAQTEPIRRSREFNDTARFVAGLPGVEGSPFIEVETSAAWKDHRQQVETAWKKADGELLDGLRQFQQRELERLPLKTTTVFYPFGGPDALTPVMYFPHSPSYVLVGLEPSGTLPSFQRIQKKLLAAYLGELRRTMASELGKSFFVTREMDRQFRGQVTDGLLLPIGQLLVRSGHTLLGFRYVRLDEDGRVVERAADYHVPGLIGNKGVEIEFQTDADQSLHRMLYFTVNLADNRLRPNQAFVKYAGSLKGATTMLKATSYMTHHPEFSVIRNLVLANSGAVFQDDSGLPFHNFTSDRWKVQLYGDYQRPYGSFKWMEQKDLRQAYQQASVRPLPMHVGYGYRKITSNLLLAERLAP